MTSIVTSTAHQNENTKDLNDDLLLTFEFLVESEWQSREAQILPQVRDVRPSRVIDSLGTRAPRRRPMKRLPQDARAMSAEQRCPERATPRSEALAALEASPCFLPALQTPPFSLPALQTEQPLHKSWRARFQGSFLEAEQIQLPRRHPLQRLRF